MANIFAQSLRKHFIMVTYYQLYMAITLQQQNSMMSIVPESRIIRFSEPVKTLFFCFIKETGDNKHE